MIAAPHIVFATTIGLSAIAAWPFLTDRDDFPLMLAQAVLLGLIAGFVLSVVLP